jgi:hypothetical protein
MEEIEDPFHRLRVKSSQKKKRKEKGDSEKSLPV